MKQQEQNHLPLMFRIILFLQISLLPLDAFCAQVTLGWNQITGSNIAGYRIFCREDNGTYNFSRPLWTGSGTRLVVKDLVDNKGYYFIVRTYTTAGIESLNSNEIHYKYSIPAAATPTIMPNGGSFSNTVQVSLNSSTSGAKIYYTTNGSTPSTSSTQYTVPFTLSTSETVKAIATASGYNNSALASATFTKSSTLTAATPTITPNGGSFSNTVQVSLNSSISGAKIYYTTNGSTPSTSSSLYAGPFTLTSTTTAKALAVAAGYNNSSVAAATFTKATTGQQPYGGKPYPVPGTIEAENYNLGGESVSYHDRTTGNMGGQYRKDDVDIWYSSSDGYYTGSNANGEWLAYTINVEKTGQYSLDVVVATPNSNRSMHAELDGVDITGKIEIPNTGSWNNWQTVMSTVTLSQGQHVLKVVFDQGGFDFNRMDIYSIFTDLDHLPQEDEVKWTDTTVKNENDPAPADNDWVPDESQSEVEQEKLIIEEYSSYQDNVKSILLEDGQRLTVESPEGTIISKLTIKEKPSSSSIPLDDLDFTYGLVDLTIENVDTNGNAIVTLYYPEDSSPEAYYKYGPTPDHPEDHWYEFMYDGETGAVIDQNIITLHFVDGKRGDDNVSVVDDKISDTVGGAVFRSSQAIQPEATTIRESNNAGGCFLQCLNLE